jgi:WD40 repeat protein
MPIPDDSPASDAPDYAMLFGAALPAEAIDIAEADGSLATLGGYHLLARIGEGGMGLVWRAREPETGRIVALKQLRFIDAALDSKRAKETAARFRREIGLAARLEHPGIARVYDTGRDDTGGQPFFTMELVEGEPLNAGGRSEAEILRLMILCCDAVEYAHRNGVIHRDLKPGNILVTRDGLIKVLDFGVARALEESVIGSDLSGGDLAITLSRDGAITGTPAYMAPEQARGESFSGDTRTDVFALGAILYQLVTGHLPHSQEGGDWAMLRRVADGEVRRTAEVTSKKISPDLEAVLMKALAHSPNDRYNSAGDLGRDLRRYLNGDPVTAQPLTVVYWLGKHIARHRGRWLAATVMLAGLVTAGSVWFWQREQFLTEQVTLRTQAEVGEKTARDSEVRSLIRVGRQQWESGARAEALAYLARAVRLDPDQREARTALMAAMKQFSTVYRASPSLRFEGSATHSVFAPDGRWFALGLDSDEAGLGFWDSETLEQRFMVKGDLRAVDLSLAPGGQYLGALMDYPSEEAGPRSSCLVLASPEGLLSRIEIPHAAARMAFSPDGDRLAVSVEALDEKGKPFGGVMIFDTRDPGNPIVAEPLRELSRPGYPRIHFSRDGQDLYYLKQEADGRVRRWNLQTGDLALTPIRLGPDGWRPLAINVIVPHPGGDMFVAGQGEFVTRWREQGNHQERAWMDRVEGCVAFRDLSLSDDSRYLAGGTSDSRCVIWDADSGARLAELPHSEMVATVRFCPGSSGLLATMTATGTVMLWDWQSGKPLAEPVEGGARLLTMGFSPDGRRLLVGRGGNARMWTTVVRKWEPEVVDLGSPLDAVSFTGYGARFVATSHASEKAYLADGSGRKLLDSWPHRTLFAHHRIGNRFDALANRERNHAVTADSPRSLKVRFLSPAKESAPLKIELKVDATAIAMTRNGRYLAVGDANHDARIFDLFPEKGQGPVESAVLKGDGLPDWELEDWHRRYPVSDEPFDNFVRHLAFSANASRLVMVEYPLSAVTVWDWRHAKRIGTQAMLAEDDILDLQVARNDRLALVGGHNNSVQSLNLDTGEESALRRLHRAPVSRLRIDHDSRRLVTAALDGEVRFWDLDDRRSRPSSRFRPGTAPILSMEMDEECVVCATGDAAGKIQLWLVRSGQPLGDPLDTGGAAVNDLAFHHRLPLLAAACADGKVRLWEIPTGRGRAPSLFAATAESLGSLYIADDGSIKEGAIFYHDSESANVKNIHREHQKIRAQTPEMHTGEYQRLFFDIHGLPEIPPPVWLNPTTSGSPESGR